MSNRLPMDVRQRLKKARDLGHATYMGRPCKNGHDGRRTLRGDCVACARNHIRKHKDIRNERAKAFHLKNPERQLLASAKARALKHGRDFNLTLEDINIPAICPVLGTPMIRPTLDRRDNALGYVKGNVKVVSFRANRLKSDANIEEIEKILKYMKNLT